MNHKFHIKGKKSGIVGSAISNFWSYVLFVFVVIIFFVFFSIQERDVRGNVIGSTESEINLDLILLNYLRTPIEIEIDDGGLVITQKKTFADFLTEKAGSLYVGNDNPSPEKLATLGIEIFDLTEKNKMDFGSVRLRIMDVDQKKCIYDSIFDGCTPRYYETVENIILLPIPVRSGELKFLKVIGTKQILNVLY
jgi:hypothetical protein